MKNIKEVVDTLLAKDFTESKKELDALKSKDLNLAPAIRAEKALLKKDPSDKTVQDGVTKLTQLQSLVNKKDWVNAAKVMAKVPSGTRDNIPEPLYTILLNMV